MLLRQAVGRGRSRALLPAIAGCGHVFDDVVLWDRHRRRGRCLDPRSLDLFPNTEGTWLRALEHSSH